MKRKIIALIAVFILISSLAVYADAPEISAPNAILVDASNGLALYEKESGEKVYPASTTKILTAIIAIEKCNLEDTATASFEAINSIDIDSSKVGLYEGEEMTCKDLIFSLLIASANDAANVLAEHISGSTSEFASLMNEKAEEIGAHNSHFENPHGLHSENHYTTASDMAKIAMYAMKLPLFAEAVSAETYTIPATNKSDKRELKTTNYLLLPKSRYYYKYATGIKTGHTKDAGYCLISSGDYEGTELICAVFGTKMTEDGTTQSFEDSRTLLRYGLGKLSPVPIIQKSTIICDAPLRSSISDKIILESESTVNRVLPEGVSPENLERRDFVNENISAPIKAGEVLGHSEYWLKDTKVAETNLVSVEEYKYVPLAFIVRPIYKMFKSAVFYIILAIIIIFLIFCAYVRAERKRRRMERRRKMREKQRMQRR